MQLAAEALQEADKWSTLSADIEETFKTQVKTSCFFMARFFVIVIVNFNQFSEENSASLKCASV